MAGTTKKEVRASDLSNGKRIFLLILVSMGSSIIYTPLYLKNVFYDQLMKATGATNAQLGLMVTAYAITATICYLPSGIVADKFHVRTLGWVGFGTTALLTFWYAFLPSITTLYIIFVGMGVTTILIWWGIRYKLIRLISEESEYSRNIGVSYGVYGAAGLILNFINVGILSYFNVGEKIGVQVLLFFLGAVILVLGILSFIFIPRFEGEITSKSSFDFSMVAKALKSPVIWLAAGSMFFVYFFYTGVNYTTPYLTDALGASVAVVSVVGIIRSYGVTLISGPVFGFFSSAAKSPSKIIIGGSLVVVVGLLVLIFLPFNASVVVFAAIIAILLGFISNGVFGIMSGQLTEGKVPLTIFGTASGLLSVVGFLPDTFSSTWFGSLMDANGKNAYPQIFWILAGAAVLAAAFAAILLVYIKKNKTRLEAEADAAAAEAEAAEKARAAVSA
ncbi:MAG: MFS transporter [Bifidobacteriaceae bacterium]|jgi:sugar phosphate permease|nr:MFS transporter [Bifidobacteriaceae bacterium]MCI1915089.1 MFS transporter [Bifidobacteriaceae bacterium]